MQAIITVPGYLANCKLTENSYAVMESGAVVINPGGGRSLVTICPHDSVPIDLTNVVDFIAYALRAAERMPDHRVYVTYNKNTVYAKKVMGSIRKKAE